MHFGDDRAMQAAAPICDAFAAKTGEPFDIVQFSRAQRGDVVIGKVAPIVESAGIAEISWWLEPGGKTNTVTVMKDRHRSFGTDQVGRGDFFDGHFGRAWTIDAEADARVDGLDRSCRFLDLVRFEVDRLANFVEATLLQPAVPRNVPGDSQVGLLRIRLNPHIQRSV